MKKRQMKIIYENDKKIRLDKFLSLNSSFTRNKVTGQLHSVCETFDCINKLSTSASSENIAAGIGTVDRLYNQSFNRPRQ